MRTKEQEKLTREKDEKVRAMAFGLAAALREARRTAESQPGPPETELRVVDGLWRTLAAERARDATDQTLRAYLVEFYRKFSMPVACLVFAFFAFPIGLLARRSGRTVGFAVGLFVAIVYWGMLFAGQTFGVRMSLSPALSMWFPDAVVFIIGVSFYARRLRR
jgi:lipopolysaccharide export system permease protein